MKYYAYLQRFYKLYANILFKSPINSVMKSAVPIFSFLLFFFMAMDIHLPSLLLNITTNGSGILHIQSFFYFLPWIYGTPSFLFDILFFFVLNIISFIFLFHAQILSAKDKYVPYWELAFIHFYQTILVPLLCYSLFFKFCLLIEQINSGGDFICWLSFSICIINIIFFFIHIYFESVFLSFIIIVSKSKFDTYDGKSNIILYLCRFLICIGSNLIDLTTNKLFIYLIAAAFLIISIFLFYRRVLLSIHNSYLSEYLEISPFFSISIVIVIHTYTKNYWLIFLALLIIHILTIAILFISHHHLVRESFRLFETLKKGDDLTENSSQFPRILPGNIVSILRIITSHSGDPMIFLNILSQRQYNIKTSPMIEIIRFLAIFPSKRSDMITELSLLKSDSNYNRFIIYFFLKYLKSMTSVSDEKHTKFLDDLQRSFLVHHHIYWKMREHKKYFRSFVEACSTSYYFIELKFELMSLIERFPFDSYLYSRYADFYLIAYGNFVKYQQSKMISLDLEQDRNLITDPILHKTITNNVRILQFCNQEEIQVSMPSHNYNSSSSNENPVASYLKTSHRLIPFVPFIHITLAIVCFAVYFALSIPFENYSINEYKNINEQSPSLKLLYMKTFSTVFYPYAIQDLTPIDFTTIHDPDVCRSTFDSIYLYISNFYLSLPQIQSLGDFMFAFFQDYFYENMKNNKTVCQSLNNLTVAFDMLLDYFMNDLYNILNSMTKNMLNLEDRIQEHKNDYVVEIVAIVIVIFIIILYIIIIIIQVNFVFRKNPNVIKFFASKKRITSLLLEQCIDSWEDLYNYIRSKKLYLLHLHSENLKEGKLANSSLNSRLSATSSSFFGIKDIDYSSFYDDSTSATVSQSTESNKLDDNSNLNDGTSTSMCSISTSTSIGNDNENEADEALTTNVFTNTNLENGQILKFKNVYDANNNSGAEEIDSNDNEINMEVDGDPIELTIDATLQQKRFAWLIVPFFILLPWFILLIVILLFMIPTFIRFNLKYDEINDYLNSLIQINHSFNLIENTLLILKGKTDYSPITFNKIHDVILQSSTNITQVFQRDQCIQLQETICSSFSNLVVEIASKHPSNDEILLRFLPAFIYFGMESLRVTFYYNIDSYLTVPTTSVIAFFIEFGIVSLILIYFSLYFGNNLVDSFNSLYHFPEIFLKKKKNNKNNDDNYDSKKKEKHHSYIIDDNNEKIAELGSKSGKKNSNETEDNNTSIQSFPSVILTVASVIGTDEIYSISENAAVILNRPAPSFIGEKFNLVFPAMQNEQREVINTTSSQIVIELREHLMPDHVKKKMFRSSSRQKGEFLISLLIEEGGQNSAKPAYKQESISERLMNFIPTYFANAFSDNNISDFIFNSTLLIFLRYDTTKPQSELERFFTLVNACVMNYTNFKIIKADGGTILFVGIKKVNKLIACLFIRDIIAEDLNFARSKPTKAPISFYIESFDSVRAYINTEDEPFLEIDIDNMSYYEALLFKVGKCQVAFNVNFINSIVEMDQISQQEQIELGNLSKNIKKVSFDKYVDLFKKCL